MTTTSLFNYDGAEPPRINETKPVHHPHRDQILGFAGVCQNREKGNCLNVLRTRHGNGDEKQDYYRKVGGYSMVKEIVRGLLSANFQLLFIEETDNDRLIEYQLSHFRDGVSLDDWKGEPQWCVPVDDAVHVWPIGETTINHASDNQ